VLLLLLVGGIIGGLFALRALLPRQGAPAPIVRQHYSVQPPDRAWEIDEGRQRSSGADLVLRQRPRAGELAYFSVQVVPGDKKPPTVEDLVTRLKNEWQAQMKGCQFLGAAGGTSTMAGQPAVRVVAVGGNAIRREAVVVVNGDIGYCLTCEAPEKRFDDLREAFDQLLASFKPTTAPAAAP
jgi:hypothetical protein